MSTRTASVLGFTSLILVAGCGAADTESTDTSTSDLTATATKLGVACATPVPSDDGRFALLYLCATATAPTKLARLDVKTGGLQTISTGITLPGSSADNPMLGTKGKHFFAITEHSGGWSIELHDWDLTWSSKTDVETLAPAGSPPLDVGTPGRWAFTEDGTSLVATNRDVSLPPKQWIFLVPVGVGVARVMEAPVFNDIRVTSSPDSKSVLLSSTGYVSRLDLASFSASKAVAVAPGYQTIETGSFDGHAVAATFLDASKQSAVGIFSFDSGIFKEIERRAGNPAGGAGMKFSTVAIKVLQASPGLVDYQTIDTSLAPKVKTTIVRAKLGVAPFPVATVAGEVDDWFESEDGAHAYFSTMNELRKFQGHYVAMLLGQTPTVVVPVETSLRFERLGDRLVELDPSGDPKNLANPIAHSFELDLGTGIVVPKDTLRVLVSNHLRYNGMGSFQYGVIQCKLGTADGQSIARVDGTTITDVTPCATPRPVKAPTFQRIPKSEAVLLLESPTKSSSAVSLIRP